MKFSHINTREIHPAYLAVSLSGPARLPYKQALIHDNMERIDLIFFTLITAGRPPSGAGQCLVKLPILTDSTLRLSLALVSNNVMPICSAKFAASSVTTTFFSGQSSLLPTAKNSEFNFGHM
jgi:hypothetical protein